MEHRKDIDGLRAIAVLSITIFHLRTSFATGGFVGVDVFYVISGFLIGGRVFSQIADGDFSIISFYYRRFRRIVPAFVAMCFGVTVAALLILYPPSLKLYAESMIAAALSVSNFYFWLNTNYFAPSAYTLPLLHTWSLAVEEQFYLLFPLLMIGLARFGARAATWVIGGIALASLAVSVIGVTSAPGATFYLLPARAWEILLGALVARGNFSVLDNVSIRQAVAALGAALIVVPICLYTEATPFPGIAALPPCLGTAMLIAAGSRGSTAVSAALSVRPVVFVGLISYSLYLWHWPVIVLMQEALPAPHLERMGKILAIVLSFGLAIFSWRYIEQPFRVQKFEPKTIFKLSGIGVAAATAIAALIVATQGLPIRFSPEVARISSYLGYVSNNREGQCFLSTYDKFTSFQPSVCLARSSDKPNVLLVGDSHAAHLWSGLTKRFPKINLMQADAVGCKPVLSQRPKVLAACAELMNYIFKMVLPAGKLDLVIISANWDADDLEPLRETLVALKASGVPVVISGPTVVYTLPLPQIVAIGLERGIPDFADRYIVGNRAELDVRMERMTREVGVEYVSVYRHLCGSGQCLRAFENGVLVSFDLSHFTIEGSDFVARAFENVLGKVIVARSVVAN